MNAVTQIAADIWIVDGANVRFLGLPIPTRMTVVRLDSGDIWVHSPIAISPMITQWLSSLGPVKMLVAPNKYHHLYLAQWVAAFPDAKLFAAPGLKKKRPDLKFDGELSEQSDPSWARELDQVIFSGNHLFDEVVFFHHISQTLILTDLIINLRTESYSLWQRLFARLDGLAYPGGSTPVLFKLAMKSRKAARRAVAQMILWAPHRVVIAHGEWFACNGLEEIRKRFRWLGGGL